MRTTFRSAAVLAAALLPTAATGWAGAAVAAPAAPVRPAVLPPDACNPSDVQNVAKSYLEWNDGGHQDPSDKAGLVVLQYSHRCRWTRGVVGLDSPLPQGKTAWASVISWSDNAVCHVAVGGSGCATTFVDDARQASYAAGQLWQSAQSPNWYGETGTY